LIKSENTPSEPQKPSIIEKIQNLKHMCMAKGRTPIILLINKRHYSELEHVLAKVGMNNVSAVLDLTVVICDGVTDFIVVDNRHWYEQTF